MLGRTWLQTHCQALREAVPGRVRACASPGFSLPASEVSVCLRERDAHPGRATHGTGRQPHRCTARSEAPAADVARSRSLARGSEAAWPPPGRRLGPGGGRARLSLGLDLGCLFRAVEKACQEPDAKARPSAADPRAPRKAPSNARVRLCIAGPSRVAIPRGPGAAPLSLTPCGG